MTAISPGLAGHKGLRGDVLVELKRAQPLTAAELAKRFGVTANAIRAGVVVKSDLLALQYWLFAAGRHIYHPQRIITTPNKVQLSWNGNRRITDDDLQIENRALVSAVEIPDGVVWMDGNHPLVYTLTRDQEKLSRLGLEAPTLDPTSGGVTGGTGSLAAGNYRVCIAWVRSIV